MERSWRPTWTNRPATSLDRARPSHVVHGVGMTSCVRFCGFGNLIARIREVLRAFPMLCRPLACGGVLSHLGVSFGSAFVWRARARPCARTQVVGKRARREAALAWCPRATVVMRRPFCPRVIALRLFYLRERRSQVFASGAWGMLRSHCASSGASSRSSFCLRALVVVMFFMLPRHCLAQDASRFPGLWIGSFFGPLSLGGQLFDISLIVFHLLALAYNG